MSEDVLVIKAYVQQLLSEIDKDVSVAPQLEELCFTKVLLFIERLSSEN